VNQPKIPNSVYTVLNRSVTAKESKISGMISSYILERTFYSVLLSSTTCHNCLATQKHPELQTYTLTSYLKIDQKFQTENSTVCNIVSKLFPALYELDTSPPETMPRRNRRGNVTKPLSAYKDGFHLIIRL